MPSNAQRGLHRTAPRAILVLLVLFLCYQVYSLVADNNALRAKTATLLVVRQDIVAVIEEQTRELQELRQRFELLQTHLNYTQQRLNDREQTTERMMEPLRADNDRLKDEIQQLRPVRDNVVKCQTELEITHELFLETKADMSHYKQLLEELQSFCDPLLPQNARQ